MSNTTDSRSVHTDALATLGTIIDDTQHRDAIHLAVIPMRAPCLLGSGTHVGKDGMPMVPYSPGAVGIVDPFLRQPVERGEWFWLVIYPRVITSLRHVWTHPAFADEASAMGETVAPSKAASEAWLRDFIAHADCPIYEEVIAKAVNNDSWDADYLHFNGQDAHGDIPDEFWHHVEVVTGRTDLPRAKYFSCGC